MEQNAEIMAIDKYRRYTTEDIQTMEDSVAGLEYALYGVKKVHLNFNRPLNESETYCIESLLNCQLYGYDIALLYKNFMLAKSSFEQKMIYRYIALLVYEYIRGTLKMIGKELQYKITLTIPEYDHESEVKTLRQQVHAFEKKYLEKFKIVRNTTAAHKDIDPHKQFNVIEELDVEDAETCVKEFFKLNPLIYNYIGSVLERVEKKSIL